MVKYLVNVDVNVGKYIPIPWMVWESFWKGFLPMVIEQTYPEALLDASPTPVSSARWVEP